MYIRLLGLFFLCWAMNTRAIAQTSPLLKDSVAVADTVIIVREPLIINKKIFIEEPEIIIPKKYFTSLYFGIELPKYQILEKANSIFKPSIHEKNYYHFGIDAHRDYKRWSVGVGIQLMYARERIQYQWSVLRNENITFLENDTLDIYTVRNPSNQLDTTVYVIEQVQKSKEVSEVENKSVQQNNKMFYLEIPISIRYKLIDKKIKTSIVLGIISGVMLGGNAQHLQPNAEELWSLQKASLTKITASYMLGLEMAYALSVTNSVFIASSYRNDIFSVTNSSAEASITRQLVQLQVGTRIYF